MLINDFAPVNPYNRSKSFIRDKINKRFQECPIDGNTNLKNLPFLINYAPITPKQSNLEKETQLFPKDDRIAPFPSLRNASLKSSCNLTEEEKVFLFFKDCPLDVQKLILSEMPLKTKLGFRASCKGLNYFILEKTNFWHQIAQKILETEIPSCIQSAFGGIDLILQFPIIEKISEANNLPLAIIFNINGNIGLISKKLLPSNESLFFRERWQCSVSSRKERKFSWERLASACKVTYFFPNPNARTWPNDITFLKTVLNERTTTFEEK